MVRCRVREGAVSPRTPPWEGESLLQGKKEAVSLSGGRDTVNQGQRSTRQIWTVLRWVLGVHVRGFLGWQISKQVQYRRLYCSEKPVESYEFITPES